LALRRRHGVHARKDRQAVHRDHARDQVRMPLGEQGHQRAADAVADQYRLVDVAAADQLRHRSDGLTRKIAVLLRRRHAVEACQRDRVNHVVVAEALDFAAPSPRTVFETGNQDQRPAVIAVTLHPQRADGEDFGRGRCFQRCGAGRRRRRARDLLREECSEREQ
jgi:hypothetical protein